MGFFDRIKKLVSGSQQASGSGGTVPPVLVESFERLRELDAEAISRGETPEARLIPKHAFKRDVIIAAYTKDFNAHLALMRSMSWTVEEKEQRIAEVKRGFEDHVGGVRQMRWPDLDKVIALMKRTRTDLKELQAEVLAKRPYPFAEML